MPPSQWLVCAIVLSLSFPAASRNGEFPLTNCSTGNMDILALFEFYTGNIWKDEFLLFRSFVQHMATLPSNTSSSRVLAAGVILDFFNRKLDANVSAWALRDIDEVSEEELYKTSLEYSNLYYQNLQMKINLVEKLFNEMKGVRKAAVHVGIIFLGGDDLNDEEKENVSYIVQQRQKTNVKIFVVIIGDEYLQSIIPLQDTLVLPVMTLRNFDQVLLMAVCKLCLPGWFTFEQKLSTHLSCYILRNHKPVDWTSAMQMCNKDYKGYLVGVEYEDEMTFLQRYLHTLLQDNSVLTDNSTNTTGIYIGLHRDTSNYAKRFQWMRKPGQFYPLVLDHWLPGKPSEGFTGAECGMWTFYKTRNGSGHNDISQMSSSQKDVVVEDGWTDVKCGAQVASLSLCEVVLPREFGNTSRILIQQPGNATVNATLAKGNFVIFKKNIVSVSQNVVKKDFRDFLIQNQIDFPLFDCKEDIDQPRYIAFSMVCDFVNHCPNGRDEESCGYSWDKLSVNDSYCFSGQRLAKNISVCDNIIDCDDGSDEWNCINFSCEHVRCCDGSCLPLQWINDGQVDCFICENSLNITESDESPSLYFKNNKTCALVCNYDDCIEESQLNDGIKQCKGRDGPLDEGIGKLEQANTCKNFRGENIWAPKCVYVVDIYNGTIGCRDMSHVRGCEGHPCGQGYVKCPNSYCIPQDYLLDEVADCPTGEDEQTIYVGPCIDSFACWGSQICLHPDLVCDDHSDCPQEDDELDCKVLCPEGFRCTGGTVTVSDYNKLISLDARKFNVLGTRIKYLDLTGIDLSGEETFSYLFINTFANVNVLILSNCSISSLNVSERYIQIANYIPYEAERLDISYNNIHEVFTDIFITFLFYNIRYLNASNNKLLVSITNLQFYNLETVDLAHTGISYLNDSVFAILPSLKHLNLSYTLISDFSRSYFPRAFTIQSLDLRGAPLDDFFANFLHDLTIKESLYVDHFQTCCPQILGLNISPQVCHAPVDAISSCLDLIGLSVQRVLLWIVAVLCVLGNLTVIIYRIVWNRQVLATGYGLFVTNLGISDLMMGIYLFIIAGADQFYHGSYVLHDRNWRNGFMCRFAGLIATMSIEASTFFIFLITLDRFLLMKFPFGQKSLSTIAKTISVSLSWLISFLLALIPIVLHFEIYSTDAMCLGLPLTNRQVQGWEYSVGVFVILNFLMLILIAYGQVAIFRALSENRISKKATSHSRSRRVEDILVIKQLSLVVVSDFVCWFPIGIMGLLSLCGYVIDDDIYAWTVVLFLPINSAANPVLYTIPAIMATWQRFKNGEERTMST